MITVYKYYLDPLVSPTAIVMPRGAKILSSQVQRGIVCMWALVDTEAPMESRRFQLLETGQPALASLAGSEFSIFGDGFIGTVQLMEGSYVLHLFEV